MNSVHVHVHVCGTLHHWIDEIEHKIFVLWPEESILLLDDGQVKIFQGNPERNSSIFLGEAKAFVTF